MAGRPSGFLVDLLTTAPVHLLCGDSQELELGARAGVLLHALAKLVL